ncbi:uncharacterized protein O3C94_023127 [Discoglossus pictus]
MSHRRVCTQIMSVCLVEVSTAVTDCSITECMNGSSCCDSQYKVYLDYGWYGPLFIGMLALFIVLCMCWICNDGCRSELPSEPPTPRLTPLTDIRAPPPYIEVTSKHPNIYAYPPSEAQPPSYNSIIQTVPTAPQWEG